MATIDPTSQRGRPRLAPRGLHSELTDVPRQDQGRTGERREVTPSLESGARARLGLQGLSSNPGSATSARGGGAPAGVLVTSDPGSWSVPYVVGRREQDQESRCWAQSRGQRHPEAAPRVTGRS